LRWIDPSGLLAECLDGFWGQIWEGLITKQKIIGYEPLDPTTNIIYTIIDAFTSSKVPGVFFPRRTPIHGDVELQEEMDVEYEICFDDCGNKVSETILRKRGRKLYRENHFIQSQFSGIPTWLPPGTNTDPTMKDRWPEYFGGFGGF